MGQKAKPSRGKIVVYSLFSSLLLHLILLLLKMAAPNPEDKPVAKKAEKRIKLIVKKRSDKKQIVTTQKKKDKPPPKDPAFLSASDQSFDRQTIAKKIAPFKNAGQGNKNARTTTAQNPSQAEKQTASKKPNNSGKKLRFQDLALELNKIYRLQNTSQANRQGLNNGNPEESGLAQNNDYIEEVPLGDVTNLNTVEYKYYGFFNRIKKKLEQHWGETLRKKAHSMYQKGRRIPANSPHITSLMVSLDSKGTIINISIKGSSGVQEFDDAALESFNKAGPFPNPPKSMIKNGAAHIEWGFVING